MPETQTRIDILLHHHLRDLECAQSLGSFEFLLRPQGGQRLLRLLPLCAGLLQPVTFISQLGAQISDPRSQRFGLFSSRGLLLLEILESRFLELTLGFRLLQLATQIARLGLEHLLRSLQRRGTLGGLDRLARLDEPRGHPPGNTGCGPHGEPAGGSVIDRHRGARR